MRNKRPDVWAIVLVTYSVDLCEGQAFYETRRAWELWQEEPLARLKRWAKDRVVWAISDPTRRTSERDQT